MNRLILATLLLATSCNAFQGPAFVAKPMSSSSTKLLAKKNKGQSAAAGQGFGKAAAPAELKQPTNDDAPTSMRSAPAGGLQSVEMGGSNAIPTFQADPNMPVEERTKQILQEQYGLRTLEDQRREEKIREQRNKIQRLKEEAEKDEDFDVFALLPPALLVGIDRFLKIGLSVCTVTFVGAGLGICAEAWSAASGNVLPEEIDSFIVNVVEPNFTPGLLVLLGFSVSLGIFATAQMGSSGSRYSEDP
eukprot:CAMPEP_0119014174 /NCGR_PEP_ID=MMETSP1176-20130426/9397_1 /TAXON_ID=265551 /ORGANISM="Synedropsis recta cf, Strain CCMP1620" /LENGTH=246 /DNA_ID=CAMNT_0006967323 /DNA_START=34 /DNA_END=774 /DNA_ORIENTATION=+